MKNLFKKLISVSVSAVMLASAAPCTFAATADGEGGLEPTEQLEYLAHRIPTAVKIYKDSDRTEQILAKDDIPLSEKVYYSLETSEGYYVKSFSSNADYLDRDCFIMSEADDSFELSEILAGDFNGDGNVNSKDVYSLVRYCAHYYGNDENKFNLEAGDYNRDGHIDSRDILGIIRYLAGWGSRYPAGEAKDFDAVLDCFSYEAGETVATFRQVEESPAVLIESAEDFRAYWEKASFDFDYIPEPEPEPDDEDEPCPESSPMYKDEELPHNIYPYDPDALFAKYDDAFFAEHSVIIASTGAETFPETVFDSVKLINGVPTVNFETSNSGVVGISFVMNQIITVDKGAISTDAEIAVRVDSGYPNF